MPRTPETTGRSGARQCGGGEKGARHRRGLGVDNGVEGTPLVVLEQGEEARLAGI